MGNITSISVLFFTNMDNYNMGRFLEYTKQYNKSYDSNQEYEDAFTNFNYNMEWIENPPSFYPVSYTHLTLPTKA